MGSPRPERAPGPVLCVTVLGKTITQSGSTFRCGWRGKTLGKVHPAKQKVSSTIASICCEHRLQRPVSLVGAARKERAFSTFKIVLG